MPCVAWGGAFLAAPDGVYYVACGSGSNADAQDVHLLHSDGRDELIGILEQPLRYLLWPRSVAGRTLDLVQQVGR